jgi:hypothetical protein
VAIYPRLRWKCVPILTLNEASPSSEWQSSPLQLFLHTNLPAKRHS